MRNVGLNLNIFLLAEPFPAILRIRKVYFNEYPMAKSWLARSLSSYRKFRLSHSPQFNVVLGFFLYTLIGWILLSLPWVQDVKVPLIDSLFISSSAISTTGLVTVSVADSFNFAGEFIVMLLFQVGGIGYMTLTTYYLLLTTSKLTHWHQKLIGTAFTMPESIKVNDFIKSVVVFTAVMETLGAIGFFIAFKGTMPAGQAVWYSIFHSVSAFSTAGFGLMNDSFMGFQDDPLVNTIISVLAIAGSLGFIVITDLWYRLTGKSKALSFTTKIVVFGFVILLGMGTAIIYFSSPLVADGGHALLKSFFQSMTAMTTVGFNTIDTGALRTPVLLLVVFLMYVGASPSGTAGGLKITTLTAVLSILKSRLLGEKHITFLNRKIPFERLYVATSTFILYTSLIFLFSFLMSFTEQDSSFENILFEVASALGTVGLSTGLTGTLTLGGKLLITLLMFIGRVGVLTFGFTLLAYRRGETVEAQKDDLAV